MDFSIPQDIADYLVVLDQFIEDTIKPLEQRDDNIRFFDHRREWARTDFDKGGLPRQEWEDLLKEARRLADEAGHFRYALPKEYGGQDGTNLGMAIIREHLAAKGLGLHNDLQNEHSIVANNVGVLLMLAYGTVSQKEVFLDGLLEGVAVSVLDEELDAVSVELGVGVPGSLELGVSLLLLKLDVPLPGGCWVVAHTGM